MSTIAIQAHFKLSEEKHKAQEPLPWFWKYISSEYYTTIAGEPETKKKWQYVF